VTTEPLRHPRKVRLLAIDDTTPVVIDLQPVRVGTLEQPRPRRFDPEWAADPHPASTKTTAA
jgi:hypothetical protein